MYFIYIILSPLPNDNNKVAENLKNQQKAMQKSSIKSNQIFFKFNYKDKNGYLTQDEFIEELGHMFQTMEAIKSFSILKKGFLD